MSHPHTREQVHFAGEPSAAILLSVKPVFASLLVAGVKSAEIRRSFPSHLAGHILFIYSSSPDRQVIGTVRIESIMTVRPGDAWTLFGPQLHIRRDLLETYLAGTVAAQVLSVSEPVQFEHAVSLDALRELVGISPPQSYRYLTREKVGLLTALGTADGFGVTSD